MSADDIILVTVSGPDAPGITSQLTGVLAETQTQLIDIGQSVLHGWLSLSLLFQLSPEHSAQKTTLKDLLFKAAELGLKLEFQVFDQKTKNVTDLKSGPFQYAVTLLADEISASQLHAVTQVLLQQKLNIDVIKRLSDSKFSCLEILASAQSKPDIFKLKEGLLEISTQKMVDIAFQANDLLRRQKRLVVMDMDSTLIQNEVIDEFARVLGVYDEVSAITAQAMAGKIDFDESLKRRCAFLKGLTKRQVDEVYDRLTLTPGANELVTGLKKLGYKIAVISGGFSCVADRLRVRLGLDYSYANHLEMGEDGNFTGRVIPPILNAQRKADLLDVIAQQERVDLAQVIAIGDGANDLLMLEKAGLGIAFNAKPLVRERADLALNLKNLKSIFYLLGISERDIQTIL